MTTKAETYVRSMVDRLKSVGPLPYDRQHYADMALDRCTKAELAAAMATFKVRGRCALADAILEKLDKEE